jgi:hypothetical protein
MAKPTPRSPRLQLDPRLRERLALKLDPRLAVKVDLTPPKPKTKSKAKRKKGGGRKPDFTPEEAAQLQDAFRCELAKDSKLKDAPYSLMERRLRQRPQLLPKVKTTSPRALKRHVFWPVLGKRK